MCWPSATSIAAGRAGRTPGPSPPSCPRTPGRSAPPATAPPACANKRGPWCPLTGGRADDFENALLIRRSLTDDARAYYLTHAPAGTPLSEIVRTAGARWAIEECFQAARNEAGLNHYQVRHYPDWYRHITLAMPAAAPLTALRATTCEKGDPDTI